MHRMWDSIVFPFIKEIKPKNIVEVGSENGINTIELLKYCEEFDAHLTTIDPFPLFNVSEFKNKYGKRFNMIEDLSLNILPSLNNYDLILLDGDHNWYSIYNELKSIEKNFNQNNFPFIIFHDISWPYGRRDMYYNPDNIPKEYINEYEQKGMFPEKNELLDFGGLNPSLFNAKIENTPKNGVLTGIEDFIIESNIELTFRTINAFHGLGILFRPNNKIDKLIDDILLQSNITGILENHYLKEIVNKNNSIKRKDAEINKLKSENQKLRNLQEEIISSNSWKVTRLFRDIRRLLR